MKKEVVIIIAEDDEGHAILIRKNLKRAGLFLLEVGIPEIDNE